MLNTAAHRLVSLELYGTVQDRVSFLTDFAAIAPGLSFHSQDTLLGDLLVLAAQGARGELPERTVWAQELLPAEFTERPFPRRLALPLQEERTEHRTPENRPLLIITIVHV